MARVGNRRLALRDRTLRVHAYRDARLFGAVAAWSFFAFALLTTVSIGFPIVRHLPLFTSLLALSIILLTGFAIAAALIWIGAAWGAASHRASIRISDALYAERGGRRLEIPVAAIQRAHLRRRNRILTLVTDLGTTLSISIRGRNEALHLLDTVARAGATASWRARVYLPAPPRAREILSLAYGAAVVLLVDLLPGTTTSFATACGALFGVTTWFIAQLTGFPRRRADLLVGRDGLAFRRHGRERFIAFARIQRAEPTERGVRLVLSSGEHVEFDLTPPALRRAAESLTSALCARRCAHLLHLIEEPRALSETSPVADELLARRGRPLPDWQAALRGLVTDEGATYRTVTLAPERALQVLEDGRAPLELRIGAAMALAPTRERNTSRRLRLAIATSASEEVRTALEEAAEGELQEATLARARMAVGDG
ncbi:hypothetical protein [Chondromyces crocatus]|uniref:hypothetical protein n=1 Tax=Chondromyces crocatus TaxID=52 RepID=UPI0012E1793B|nr:hypothetical protein [Chondromyces crocatus]